MGIDHDRGGSELADSIRQFATEDEPGAHLHHRIIEVSRGSNRVKGTRRGLIWGAAVGTAVGLATHLGAGPQIRPLEGAGGDLGRAAVGGLAVGAAVGGVLGYLLPTERWIPVQLPRRGLRTR